MAACFLIMPLLSIAEHFAEPSCKCRRFTAVIKVRDIPESSNAEVCNTLTAFFSTDCCNRGRSSDKTMPENHRRDTKKMSEHHTFNSKMTEQCDCILIGTDCVIAVSGTFIAVLSKQCVQTVMNIINAGFHIRFGHHRNVSPLVLIIIFGQSCGSISHGMRR